MFDIEAMIRNSDFTKLLNSTKEERELFGGNQLIYKQLSEYACLNMVKQVILHVFYEDNKILNQLKHDCHEGSRENTNIDILHTEEENILLK
jgi:hypothetical protein